MNKRLINNHEIKHMYIWLDWITAIRDIDGYCNYLDKNWELILNKWSEWMYRSYWENIFTDIHGFIRLKYSDGWNYYNIKTKTMLFSENRNYIWIEEFMEKWDIATVVSIDDDWDYICNFINTKWFLIMKKWFLQKFLKKEDIMIIQWKYAHHSIYKLIDKKWTIINDSINIISERDKAYCEYLRMFNKKFYKKYL